MLIVVVMMILLIMVMVVRIVRNAISAVHRWRQSQSSWSVRERSATVIVSSVFFLFRFLNRCFLSIVSCVHVLLVFYCNLLTGEMCTINICCCNTPAGPERRNIFFTKRVHVPLLFHESDGLPFQRTSHHAVMYVDTAVSDGSRPGARIIRL